MYAGLGTPRNRDSAMSDAPTLGLLYLMIIAVTLARQHGNATVFFSFVTEL